MTPLKVSIKFSTPSSEQYFLPNELTCKIISQILSPYRNYTSTKVQSKWMEYYDFSLTDIWKFQKSLKAWKKLKEFYYKVYSNTLSTMSNLKFLNFECLICFNSNESIQLLKTKNGRYQEIIQIENDTLKV